MSGQRGAGDPSRTDGRLRVAVVDYFAGNLVSVGHGLSAAGADVRFVREPSGLVDVDAVVVPGVGASGPAMDRLIDQGLMAPIGRWVAAGRPLLGICLGMQLLFDGSDEDGARTFGFLSGRTRLLRDAPTLPHIGWNQVRRRRDHVLFDGIADGADFYFVHSYAGMPDGPEADATIVAETEHGGRFVSAIASGNVLGLQFHPERSGGDGVRVLANFVRWATALSAGLASAGAAVGAGGGYGGD